MKNTKTLVSLLVVIGALNWGLIGLLGFNLVEAILGAGSLSRIVYVLVGVAGALLAWQLWGEKAGSSRRR